MARQRVNRPVLVAIIALVVATLALVVGWEARELFAADRCLDPGARWRQPIGACDGAGPR